MYEKWSAFFISALLTIAMYSPVAVMAQDTHFDPKGSLPSKYTIELRNRLPCGTPPRSSGPDVVRAMSTEMWLDFLGISMDPKRAEGISVTINLVTPDNGQKYLVELSNATLTDIEGEQAKNPDLTITGNRTDLNQVMMGVSSFDDLIKVGKATFDGDRKSFDQPRSLMVPFTPDFEILPGTFEVTDLIPADLAGD